jgi:hypothetical protein
LQPDVVRVAAIDLRIKELERKMRDRIALEDQELGSGSPARMRR